MLQTEPTSSQDDAGSVGPPNVAHLLAQINFLHGEVDRLEGQLDVVRARAFKESKDSFRQYELIIEQKNAELNEWRSKTSAGRSEVDLPKRCSALEKQLALVNSEKSVLGMEKNDLQAKVRKLEAQLKSKKSEMTEAQKRSSEESAKTQARLAELSEALKKVASDNEALKKQLHEQREAVTKQQAKPLTTDAFTEPVALAADPASTQTDSAPAALAKSVDCQVETAVRFVEEGNQSVHQLYQALERKTQECDGFRARLDDLLSVQEDTLRMLETTKRRLAEEIEQRKLVADDAEKLTIQLRSLQQKTSTQAAAERDLSEKVHALEAQRQQFHVEALRMERERTELVNQLQQYEKDMEHLSANKNYSHQQLSALANENEGLRAEVQRLMVRESQLSFSLKAKDGEMHEILEAYQSAAKETESTMENQRFLERELDNARATIASKEEGMIFLQEQLSGLHRREQQLILDIQSFEYDNDQLHHKLIRSDDAIGQLEAKCVELQQFLHVRELTIEETHQSLAELSKQIVIKENESMLLRRRCDGLENDVAKFQTAASAEAARNRDLEEANARLLTRDVLSSYNNYEAVALELNAVKTQLSTYKSTVSALEEKLSSVTDERKALATEMERTKSRLAAANESKERLEKIVMDQTRALSTLSK